MVRPAGLLEERVEGEAIDCVALAAHGSVLWMDRFEVVSDDINSKCSY